MVKFSRWDELQKARAELKAKGDEVDALRTLEYEENQAIIKPLAAALEKMNLVHNINAHTVAEAMLKNSEVLVSLLAPDIKKVLKDAHDQLAGCTEVVTGARAAMEAIDVVREKYSWQC